MNEKIDIIDAEIAKPGEIREAPSTSAIPPRTSTGIPPVKFPQFHQDRRRGIGRETKTGNIQRKRGLKTAKTGLDPWIGMEVGRPRR